MLNITLLLYQLGKGFILLYMWIAKGFTNEDLYSSIPSLVITGIFRLIFLSDLGQNGKPRDSL